MIAPPQVMRIEHGDALAERTTAVDCTLGNICNYHCSYCPSRLHDGSSPWLPTPPLSRFLHAFHAHVKKEGRELYVQFTGGEPSLHPGFVELASGLSKTGIKVGLISNGSRSLDWWSEAAPFLSNVVLTHHIEHAVFERFLALIERLCAKARVHVNMTMLPAEFSECDRRAQVISTLFPQVSITLKPLLKNFGSKLYEYTDWQSSVLEAGRYSTKAGSPRQPIHRGEMRVTLSNGSSRLASASHLLASGQNKWKGWMCHAGLELLVVNMHGDIFRAVCRQGGAIASIYDATWSFPTLPYCCEMSSCDCLMDIMTTKYRKVVSGVG